MQDKKLLKIIISIFLLALVIVTAGGIWVYNSFNNRLAKIEQNLDDNLSDNELLGK